MITLYTTVRGFAGEFDHIQRNAIGSWLRLEPTPEVILFGDDEPGAQEFAAGIGLPIYPLKRGWKGIPLVNHPIHTANGVAGNEIRCLINADIILTRDFILAIRTVAERFDQFLAIPKRWDLKVSDRLDFSPGWQEEIRREVDKRGWYKGPLAIDAFCYRGGFWGQVPDFLMGRSSWDNWLVGKALKERIPLVDVSDVATCIHQEHHKRRQDEETQHNQAILNLEPGKRPAGFARATWHLCEDLTFERTKRGKQ